MRLVDLTCPIEADSDGKPAVRLDHWTIQAKPASYVAHVYHFDHDSMAGTYLDLPGHIEHTDDGRDAENVPLDEFFRVRATVIHLDRSDGSGRISKQELSEACLGGVSGGALVVNALGPRRFDRIALRSVYLGADAVEWIIATGIHLFISDVYESHDDPQGVFPALFGAGVSTVCQPINLHELAGSHVRLTVLPLRFPSVTQLPCRVLAEVDD